MANSTSFQILEDGPRNVVVKFEGVLDTSDYVGVAGAISTTATTFNTTAGARTISFTAGATTPQVGQFVTFADGTTTFPALTYITAVTDSTHIIVNNKALITNTNINNVITGIVGPLVLLDPALLTVIDATGNNITPASQLRIDKIMYNIEDALSVNLFWDATTAVRVEELVGRGKMDYFKYGGLVNNAGAGKTGRISFTTTGWASSLVLSFSLIIHLVKQ